jgi:hypothetical protein
VVDSNRPFGGADQTYTAFQEFQFGNNSIRCTLTSRIYDARMKFAATQLDELAAILKDEYRRDFTSEEVSEIAHRLMNFVSFVHQTPLPGEAPQPPEDPAL